MGETRGTVAVRVPDDEFALKLLTEHGPLAVSSANKTGQEAALDAQTAIDSLGEDVAVVIDGGARPKPLESEPNEDGVVVVTERDHSRHRPRFWTAPPSPTWLFVRVQFLWRSYARSFRPF